nr:MAG TPA: hypothetical protein [Caudoviricetes sp.]
MHTSVNLRDKVFLLCFDFFYIGSHCTEVYFVSKIAVM